MFDEDSKELLELRKIREEAQQIDINNQNYEDMSDDVDSSEYSNYENEDQDEIECDDEVLRHEHMQIPKFISIEDDILIGNECSTSNYREQVDRQNYNRDELNLVKQDYSTDNNYNLQYSNNSNKQESSPIEINEPKPPNQDMPVKDYLAEDSTDFTNVNSENLIPKQSNFPSHGSYKVDGTSSSKVPQIFVEKFEEFSNITQLVLSDQSADKHNKTDILVKN